MIEASCGEITRELWRTFTEREQLVLMGKGITEVSLRRLAKGTGMDVTAELSDWTTATLQEVEKNLLSVQKSFHDCKKIIHAARHRDARDHKDPQATKARKDPICGEIEKVVS